MSVHGSGYLKVQIDEREAEIARLQHDIERHIAICGDLATENEKLRAALEAARTEYQKINCTPSNIIAAIEQTLAKEGK